MAGRVDAAVTWEPWLTRGNRAEHGHVLVDSSTSPGLITDVLVTTAKRLETRTADLQAFYRAWVRAVEWRRANEQAADVIMARWGRRLAEGGGRVPGDPGRAWSTTTAP